MRYPFLYTKLIILTNLLFCKKYDKVCLCIKFVNSNIVNYCHVLLPINKIYYFLINLINIKTGLNFIANKISSLEL